MNNQHFNKHYQRMTSHINFLINAMRSLECTGGFGVNQIKFHQRLKEYRRQIGLYINLRQKLSERYYDKRSV